MTARNEQETIIRFCADDDTAHIWTACPAIARKLERLKVKPIRTTMRDGEVAGWFYDVPFSELRWKVGRKRVSDAARKAASMRLAQARQKKNEAGASNG